ncbi:MAG: UvrB/UvrC motif-containing protein, partial [Clostridia bacterium]|nr:UvrB/UvrC motif-containing protein [Clostridia bacterium]
IKLLTALRNGDFDVLVGINLLREGLDLPEVNLVAIVDADKEGFLRSDTALIQTIGRAARNAESKVIMYADTITDSMKRAIDETNRRRKAQMDYNQAHGIVPKTIRKEVKDTIKIREEIKQEKGRTAHDVNEEIEMLTALMKVAATSLDYETAIELRDRIAMLRATMPEE